MGIVELITNLLGQKLTSRYRFPVPVTMWYEDFLDCTIMGNRRQRNAAL